MKLKRLVVQGFKSFKDRTTINFDDGITGIVGPNGCGKSNIVDALFWVMGEMSAKHLRGKSMKDLIFAGSSKYKPGSFAEATLVLENTEKKHIHIGNTVASPSEIQLTRKLYRNGDTEYRINGEPARLKDIQEVFMDTGAGAKSYSIIAQGEINRLVQAKPEERRTMIEEVAGITKFKIRKRDSMKKIEGTRSNLARLQDLQIEIDKNLKSLQQQAEKAERARNLKEKIRRNDLVVHSHKVFEDLKLFREGQTQINEKNTENEEWVREKDCLEVGLESERSNKEEMIAEIEEFQSEFNELSKTLAASEEKLNYLCKNVTDKEKSLDQRNEETNELKTELEERSEKLKELKDGKDSLEASASEEINFHDLEEEVAQLKLALDEKRESVEEIEQEVKTLNQSLSSVDQEVFKISSKLEEYSRNLQDISLEMETLEKENSGFNARITNERNEVHALSSKLEELVEKEDLLKTEVAKKKELVENLEHDNKELSTELIKKESKKQSLVEINNSLEGTKKGGGEFLKSVEDGKYEFLGTLIQCEEKYEKGVQTLISDVINTIVAKDNNVDEVFNWLGDNSEHSIDFTVASDEIITDETLERLKIIGLTDVVELCDVINVSSEYEAKVKQILKGYFLVPTLNEELILSLSTNIKFRSIASIDGNYCVKNSGSGKTVTYISSENKEMGIVERNNLILQLSNELETLSEQSLAVVKDLEEQAPILAKLREDYDLLRIELSDIKTEHAAKSSALESKLSNLDSVSARIEILQKRRSDISKNKLDILESEEQLNKELSEKKAWLAEKEVALGDAREAFNELSLAYGEKNDFLVEKQVEIQTFKERINSFENQIEDHESQIERHNKKIESNQILVENLEEELQSVEAEIEEVEGQNSELSSTLAEKEEELKLNKEQLAELLQGMQERESKVKKLSDGISANEKSVLELRNKIAQAIIEEEQATKDMFEKYQVDLREVLGEFLEFSEQDYEGLNDISSMYTMETLEGIKEIEKEPYEFNRRYGQDLKDCSHKLKKYKSEYARLGNINWEAVADYDRQKLRHDFLKEQEVELKQSLEDLEQAIGHIDEKSKERFKLAFNEVNERFEKVFPVIFGGGSARLEVVGSLDSPECGVDIIAQPPGKKMQNINLMSGGEKAMTAVSLIFSIFLVKPSPFCLLDEVDAPLDDANVGRFNELLREMSSESQFILITHNKKTMELNDVLYGVTMQEPGISNAVSVQLH